MQLSYFEKNLITEEELPSPLKLKEHLPLSFTAHKTVSSARETLQHIIDGNDERFLVVLGPCSIESTEAALTYAQRLLELQKRIEKHFFLVMRVYLEKPRTLFGWKGFLLQPELNRPPQPEKGLYLGRKLLLDLAELGVPVATEFLTPLLPHYFSDLISWGSIGARTAASAVHRQLASYLPMPIGIKNSVEGSILTAVQGIQVARKPQEFFGLNAHGNLAYLHSTGNPYAHVVLRGGEQTGPNYDRASILKTLALLKEKGLPEKVFIDTSHDNSGKNHDLQPAIFANLLQQPKPQGVFGAMIESYLLDGKQNETEPSLQQGLSLTDACLGWEKTEQLLLHVCS